MVRRALAAVVAALALAGCAGASGGLPRSAPSVAPLSPAPGSSSGQGGTVAVGGCPVDEPRFCHEASALANALTQGSSEAVFALSRSARYDCATLDPDVFPQCERRDELRGYAVGTSRGELFVLPADEYRRRLRFFVEAVDEEYSDELGPADMRIIGVSACGQGEDRSYHLVYTVGLGDPESTFPGARFLGTYELTRRDRGWAIAVAYVGLLTDWELVLDDPLTEIGCGAIQAWG